MHPGNRRQAGLTRVRPPTPPANKLEATEMSVRVTNQAMQLHGGNGYTTERLVERHWRDARLTTIFEGTSEIQKQIISDRLLPRSPLT